MVGQPPRRQAGRLLQETRRESRWLVQDGARKAQIVSLIMDDLQDGVGLGVVRFGNLEEAWYTERWGWRVPVGVGWGGWRMQRAKARVGHRHCCGYDLV